MGVPTSEVGCTPAMLRREDNEVHKGHVVALGEKKKYRSMLKILEALRRITVTSHEDLCTFIRISRFFVG
jgi:hypothetical protein